MNQNKNKTERTRFLASTLIAGAVTFSGCSGLSLFSNRAVADDPVNEPSRSGIAKIMGPTERGLRNLSHSRREPSADGVTAGTDADLNAANAKLASVRGLFEDGKYAAAEKAAKDLVAERRATYESRGSGIKKFWGFGELDTKMMYDNFGDPVEEDALYIQAEAQFAQRRFTKAQDSYDDLLNRYPSTRHMDRVTKQMFRMARYWLDFDSDLGKAASDIQLASNEEAAAQEAPEPKRDWDGGILPNLTDKTRPIYDADGRGLQALRTIWLHDATGPLADDALMLAANHNLRIRNFVEAKRLYGLLREQYPDSPHLKDAFLLGSHVTLASYEGPAYDGAALEDSRDLKQTMIQIFPDLTSQERQMLEGEINQLHDAEIERLWSTVEYYQRKGTDEAVALHCNLIINRYPNSRYAEQARETLRGLQTKSNRSGGSIWAWGNGQKPAPAQTAQVPETQSDPRLKTSEPQPSPNSSADGEAEKKKRSIFSFLQKAEEAPKLEPTPPPSTEQAGRATL